MTGYSRLSAQLVIALRRNLVPGKADTVPEAGRLLWSFFIELSGTRTYHASGPNPICYSVISEYARLHRWPLQPHHVEIIRALDDAWLQHAYAKIGRSKSGSTLPPSSGQAINPAAFDAVFG